MIRAAIIIPALNEGGNIQRLLREIPDLVASGVETRVFVVNNGSTDNTPDEALAAGAALVNEPRRGYGYACAAGVAAAANDKPDIMIFMDGDGSFDPAEIPLLLRPLLDETADMVIGSRAQQVEPGAMPPHQRFGNRLVARLMHWIYGLHLSDLGPYRAIRTDLLLRLDMCEMTFGWPTEMLVKAAKAGGRIAEVPVHYRKRWSGQSKVSGTVRGSLLATYFILGVTLRYAFSPTRASTGKSKR